MSGSSASAGVCPVVVRLAFRKDFSPNDDALRSFLRLSGSSGGGADWKSLSYPNGSSLIGGVPFALGSEDRPPRSRRAFRRRRAETRKLEVGERHEDHDARLRRRGWRR